MKTGICGSDLHKYLHGGIEGFVKMSRPVVMGHESSGKVVAIGKAVKNAKVGDRVAIEPGYGCQACEFCHSGRYNLCRQELFLALNLHGSLQNYVNFREDFCYKIPDSMSYEEGALVEPVNCGVHAVKRAEVKPGSVCVIHGAGPVGLCLYMVAKATGSCKTVFTDINKTRLEFAKTLGSDVEAILLDPPTKTQPTVAEVKAEFDNPDSGARTLAKKIVQAIGQEPDICFDTTGVEMLQQASIFALKRAGLLMLIGYHHEFNVLPLVDLMVKEIDVRSIFRYNNCYKASVDLIAGKKLAGLDRMVTHRFALSKTTEAFDTFANAGKTGAIKVMIDCVPEQ